MRGNTIRSGRAFRGPFAFMHLRAVSLPPIHRLVFLVAALVYLITAWNSTGYHSADEHYQIVAFAQWKLGELPMEHLAWEFDAGIRSSLQPWIAVGVFKLAGIFGVDDPFMRSFLLRALSALLALVAMRDLLRATAPHSNERLGKAYVLLAYGLWFLPFLAVRFSSEGWSASLLVLFVSTILRAPEDRRWMWKAGSLAGMAILCRPSTGLLVVSVISWLLLVRRERIRTLIGLGASLMGILFIGSILDALFYERTVHTLWAYLALGFGADTTIQFDVLPWWYYPPWIIKYAISPIGTSILLAFLVVLVHKPKHVLIWCMLPFATAHSVIPHKELRFLYPLAPLVPWLLIEAWFILAPWLKRFPRELFRVLAALLVVTNLVGLAVVVRTPAGEGRVRLAKALFQQAVPGDRIGYVVEPAFAWRIALPGFYQPKGTHEVVVAPGAVGPAGLRFLVVQDGEEPRLEGDPELVPLQRSQPRWSDGLMRAYTWHEGAAPWTLYRVEHEPR